MTFLESFDKKFFQDIEDNKEVLSNDINLHYFLNNTVRLRYGSVNYNTKLFKEDSITDEYLDSIIELIRSSCAEKPRPSRSTVLNSVINDILNENPCPSASNVSIFNNVGSLFVSYDKFFKKSYHIRLSRYV